jgi:hypothetical protein
VGKVLNGCHLWECEGTWFPHTPHSGGVYYFFDEVEKTNKPHGKALARGSVRFIRLRKQHTIQVKPVEGGTPLRGMRMKLTLISHWGAAPNPFLFWFFSVWAKLSCKNHR